LKFIIELEIDESCCEARIQVDGETTEEWRATTSVNNLLKIVEKNVLAELDKKSIPT
jgi:hypothetical protein